MSAEISMSAAGTPRRWNQANRSLMGVVVASMSNDRVPATPCANAARPRWTLAASTQAGPATNACAEGDPPSTTMIDSPPITRKDKGAAKAMARARTGMRAQPQVKATAAAATATQPGQGGVSRAVMRNAPLTTTFSPTRMRRQGLCQAASSSAVRCTLGVRHGGGEFVAGGLASPQVAQRVAEHGAAEPGLERE